MIGFQNNKNKFINHQKRSAIIIHGMLSASSAMKKLSNSLIANSTYDRIHKIEMDIEHKVIPKIGSENRAKKVIPKIHQLIKRGKLTPPIDIIGHSNGGYVAINLANIGQDIIENVFTISTPHFESCEWITKVEVPEPLKQNIYHIWGAKDFFNFWGKGTFNPANGHTWFLFADEGHCSIHEDSKFNGIDELIKTLATKKANDYWFYDGDILHIWPWCRNECNCNSNVKIPPRKVISICNGIHDLDYNKLITECENKKIKISVNKEHSIQQAGKYIWLTAINIFRMENYYQKKKNELLLEQRSLKNILEEECQKTLASEKELKHLENRVKHFEIKLDEEFKKIVRDINISKNKTSSAFKLALMISHQDGLNDERIKKLICVLKEANSTHDELISKIVKHNRIGVDI